MFGRVSSVDLAGTLCTWDVDGLAMAVSCYFVVAVGKRSDHRVRIQYPMIV